MKPVKQTMDGPKEGNCLQACIASLFELALEDVPHFILEDDWVKALDNWLAQFDLQSADIDIEAMILQGDDMWKPYGYHLICGKSPRADCEHAVVGYGGEMVHDPHWDGNGLEIERTWTLFIRRFRGEDEMVLSDREVNCRWKRDSDHWNDDRWETSCGNAFYILDGNPQDNRFVFCPYCGGKIEVSDAKS